MALLDSLLDLVEALAFDLPRRAATALVRARRRG